MEANEIMIGDLLRVTKDVCIKKGTIVRVRTIDADDSLPQKGLKCAVRCQPIDDIYRMNIGGVWLNFLEPIPLTAEILEKNGWIKTKYSYGRDCMEIQGVEKLPEGVDNALSFARWSIDKQFQYHFLELYMWKGHVMRYNVHYIHQLQHAFRLFGIEKEIVL